MRQKKPSQVHGLALFLYSVARDYSVITLKSLDTTAVIIAELPLQRTLTEFV